MRKFKKTFAMVLACVAIMSMLAVTASAQIITIQPGQFHAKTTPIQHAGVYGYATVYSGSCSNVEFSVWHRPAGSSGSGGWMVDSRIVLSPGQTSYWQSVGWYPTAPRQWEVNMITLYGTNTWAEVSKYPG